MNVQEAIKLTKIYYQEGNRIEQVTKENINEKPDLIYRCIVGASCEIDEVDFL